jgi:hypothetical protein
VPIDPKNPRIKTKPVPVLSGVEGDESMGASYFSIADDGSLAWSPAAPQENLREIGWFDRSGRWTPVSLPGAEYRRLILSPDGTRALMMAGPGGGSVDLWLADLRTGAMNRLTYGGRGGSAVWLPGQTSFVYTRTESAGGESVVLRRIDGSSGERVLYRSHWPQQVSDVVRGGQAVLSGDYGFAEGRIREIPVDGASAVREVAGEGGSEQAGVVSPDGRWLAFISDKTRREEVCVRRMGGASGSWQVSNDGGRGVRWGRDGRELFFESHGNLMRVPMTVVENEPSFGAAEALFELPPSPTESTYRDYSYDPKTDRFLCTRPPRGIGERRELDLSIGWGARLISQLRTRRQAKP